MAVKRLGKGLGALIPEMATSPGSSQPQTERIREVEVAKVKPNPFQPRETFDPTALAELKQSISANGIIQPITVRETASGFELIAGERRLRAVSELGFENIPAYILDVKSDQEMIELSLIENIQRENLNPIDEANGYQTLISECELTQDEVARRVGKDRSTITNFLRLLKLPMKIQESLISDEITQGHARALLAVEDKSEQIALWKKTVAQKYSVRKIEDLVKKARQGGSKTQPQRTAPSLSPFLQAVENKMRTAFATQVRIQQNPSGKGGKIELEFYSDDDIERISELLDGL